MDFQTEKNCQEWLYTSGSRSPNSHTGMPMLCSEIYAIKLPILLGAVLQTPTQECPCCAQKYMLLSYHLGQS